VNRRAFIAAIFGSAAAMTWGDKLALPVGVEPPPAEPMPTGQWWRPQMYYYAAELREQRTYVCELKIERNFLLTGISWDTPNGAIVEMRQGETLLARAVLNPDYIIQKTVMRLAVPVLVPAGESLAIVFQNLPQNFLWHHAQLLLSGQQELTQEEVAAAYSETVDAEFDDEEETECADD